MVAVKVPIIRRTGMNERKRFSLELSEGLLNTIDQFKREWGLRSRGAIVERLLQELLTTQDSEDIFGDEFYSEDLIASEAKIEISNSAKYGKELGDTNKIDNGNNPDNGTDRKDPSTEKNVGNRSRPDGSASPSNQQTKINGLHGSDFNERGSLVLVAKGAGGALALDFVSTSSDANENAPESSARSGGIDLPGFVRKQSAQIKRSLTPTNENSNRHQEPLPTVTAELLSQALERANAHWLELYGTPANEAVLEAAMVWLAKDIWPQCDQSEGRLFTWSLACSVIEAFAPTWPTGEASFEKVMVMAGLLEDPFSTSTLQLRLPTLIRRFVHRFRTRKRGTSFQALEHTMTLHGALKLLQLPTSPGDRLELTDIREAYRVIALKTHPDSGGSEEEMRKVNEAYQLLKELYRNR